MIAFRTKAQTLEALETLVKKSRILPQIRFTVDEYRAARAQTIKRMEQFADGGSVIVRSSALCEDSASESRPGSFSLSPMCAARRRSERLPAAWRIRLRTATGAI